LQPEYLLVKLLYTNENRFLVSNAKNIIENAGIPVFLKNEYAAGGSGDLAPLETWLELWVAVDSDYEKAVQVLESSISPQGSDDWTCQNCSEQNDASFEFCWNCQSERL